VANQAIAQSPSSKLINRWEGINQKLAALAEDFPENKFEYRPVEGTRTFADVLRHVAFWNRYVADSVRGKKVDDTTNELPKSEFSTKVRVVDVLKRSAADVSDALKQHKSGLTPEIAETLATFIEHNREHYGQLAVYARLNGMIPPASRG
jgi:uncharacterized damage-inducible protein DinB